MCIRDSLRASDPGRRTASVSESDLLAGTPSAADDENGALYGRLAEDNHLPAGPDLPGGVF